ncbi:MAG: 4-hydroxy-tetrahydrodipicolinate synthase [Desulfobacterales bacterium]|jgi:4-hydroxy-tetrahydrodipicolinate synthase
MKVKAGCYTALVTPFDGAAVDTEGLSRLIDFQIENGITGILAVGTTGESPTLSWEEHNTVVEAVAKKAKDKCICIAGTGSNNTAEALEASRHAVAVGADAVLLVDPYYNGPSSIEIRREYVAPIAEAFPQTAVIPYVIPGRTGCQLLAEDLALLNRQYPNVSAVKEATANPENMRHTRACCGDDFMILSGDDAMTFEMMTDPKIGASGVISVVSNVVPGAVVKMVGHLIAGDRAAAEKVLGDIKPLFGLVTVKNMEQTPFGEVEVRARNPLAIKTLMAILGMPSGPCRRPLGKMSPGGLAKVVEAARAVQARNPDIFRPIAEFFGMDVDDRLSDPERLQGLSYESY